MAKKLDSFEYEHLSQGQQTVTTGFTVGQDSSDSLTNQRQRVCSDLNSSGFGFNQTAQNWGNEDILSLQNLSLHQEVCSSQRDTVQS